MLYKDEPTSSYVNYHVKLTMLAVRWHLRRKRDSYQRIYSVHKRMNYISDWEIDVKGLSKLTIR